MIEHPSLDKPTSGSIRFNTDSSKLEIYNGEAWFEIDSTSPEEQTGGTRGLWGGGGPSGTDRIDFVTIETTGNAIDFGNLLGSENYTRGYGNRTRGLWAQSVGPVTNQIEFITIAQQGNSQDFGNLTQSSQSGCHTGNSTRCVFFEGTNPTTNVISYVTIASTGNAVDFGDMTESERDQGSCASPTRAIIAGGYSTDPVSGSQTNAIEYITMSTLGNGSDFGDLTEARMGGGGASNAVRGIFSGGHPANATMDSIEIATLGNAVDFGDLIRGQFRGATASSPTRYVYFGGNNSPYREMQYVEFSTRGNAIDFGDYSPSNQRYDIQGGGCSNGHGGL